MATRKKMCAAVRTLTRQMAHLSRNSISAQLRVDAATEKGTIAATASAIAVAVALVVLAFQAGIRRRQHKFMAHSRSEAKIKRRQQRPITKT